MVRRRALMLLVSLLAGCCANTYDKESRLHASVNTAVGTGCARINTARMTDPVLADESYWGNGFYFEMFVDGWSREKQVTVEVGPALANGRGGHAGGLLDGRERRATAG